MTPEEIVAKYQKRVDDVHKNTDNRVTHAWAEGTARSEMVLDIHAAIYDASRPLICALRYALSKLENISEPAWSGMGGDESIDQIRTAIAKAEGQNS